MTDSHRWLNQFERKAFLGNKPFSHLKTPLGIIFWANSGGRPRLHIGELPLREHPKPVMYEVIKIVRENVND